MIHRLDILRYEYPELTLAVQCGSGTYIRSLGRDMAGALGTAAVMSALQRTAIGGFSIDDACQLEQLNPQTLEDYLLPAIRAVDQFPLFRLSAGQIEEIAHGRAIRGEIPGVAAYAAAVDDAGTLLGLLRRLQPGVLQPHRNFAAR